MQRRFGESATILYHDTGKPDVRTAHAEMVTRIQDEGLLYPVTVIDGSPVYDGAVSHAVILRAVQSRLEPQAG